MIKRRNKMNLFYKSIYKPRFPCYGLITGLVLIFDGIVTIFVTPFGYSCGIYSSYCEWNVKNDLKRMRKSRTEAKEKMINRMKEDKII